MRVGDALTVFDGHGRCHAATLADNGPPWRVEIGAPAAGRAESPCQITLAQAVAKGERMDYCVQKAVELGVAAIVPLLTARTVVRLAGNRARRRQMHWQGVAIAACEQCGRTVIPPVSAPQPLEQWMAQDRSDLRLLLNPEAQQSIRDLDPQAPQRPISVLVGPEGGFTAEEVALARRHGFSRIRLGPRILRSETAGLALITAAQLLWGDLGH